MIRALNLTRTFGDFTAVNDILFEIQQGEMVAFLGPNGAGKTTTIKMLTTLLKPTSGTIELNGLNPERQPNEVRKLFGIVFQDPSLDDELTALENMEMHGALYKVPRRICAERTEKLLNLFELWDRRKEPVKRFSGGMRRRLEIARGLLHTPKILFLDEPTLGLDPQTRNQLWNQVRKLNAEERVTVFLTPQNGNTGNLRFAITTNGGGSEQQINCNSTLSTGSWHQVAVTLSGGTGTLYLDGVAAGTNPGMTLNPSGLGSTVNNYLGKSQYPDPGLDGSFDEFRIYNAALSPAEIAATAALGSGQLLSTNRPAMNLARTGTNLTFSWPLANPGFTLQSRTNLVFGNWINVTSPAPQIVSNQWQVALASTNADSIFYRLIK